MFKPENHHDVCEAKNETATLAPPYNTSHKSTSVLATMAMEYQMKTTAPDAAPSPGRCGGIWREACKP